MGEECNELSFSIVLESSSNYVASVLYLLMAYHFEYCSGYTHFEVISFCLLFLSLCSNTDTEILLSEIRSSDLWTPEVWLPDFRTIKDFFVCVCVLYSVSIKAGEFQCRVSLPLELA